ncbi:hypothetical protein [Rasiella sp. SM2506]|uniref:hypothetical protein n=1 Tax=Rasiella sp. SM2506 TaxID=3423914 RepID=UPI003D7A534A
METGMIVIAVVLFAAVLVPTLLIIQNTKQKSKRLYNGLNAVVAQKNGVLSHHIEQNNFALGIDETHKALYFFKKTEDIEISEAIDLSKVTTCEISTKTRRLKKEKGFEELIEKITLVFVSKNNNETRQIELYNEEDTLLTDEITIAEDWKKRVQSVLSQKNVVAEQKKEQKFSAAVA